MRFKGLFELKRQAALEIVLGTLPEEILMSQYAMAKAFKINELVRAIHGASYEWYGFTTARRGNPELIVDIGLPSNDQNIADYTSVGAERIAEYREALPEEQLINGWIHSHGSLEYERFSTIDERNQGTVLDYVASRLRKPVAKREVVIRDLVLLEKGRWTDTDLERGSVCLITDAPVSEARILETVYGGFCYAMVIGDAGWHKQEIHYRRRGILSGQASESRKAAAVILVETGQSLTPAEMDALGEEVRQKIRPGSPSPRERYEKEGT